MEENIANPKEYLINLARRAKIRDVKADLLPDPRSEAAVGTAYNDRLSAFARESWQPTEAANHCISLQRALARINGIIQNGAHAFDAQA